MKRKLFTMTLVAGAVALSFQQPDGYKVTGSGTGLADGEKIYLSEFANRQLVHVDSTVVKNGMFTFTGKTGTEGIRYITKPGEKAKPVSVFFLTDGDIKIEVNKDGSKVSGTAANNAWQAYNEEGGNVNKRYMELSGKLKKDTLLTAEQKEAIEAELDGIVNGWEKRIVEFAEQNIDNPLGKHIITQNAYQMEADKTLELIGKMPEKYAQDPATVRTKEAAVKKVATSVGKKFTDFTQNDMNGQPLSLSSVVAKNKLVLVDFWASWCGPCRREMPNVVAAYEKFKSQGFEIVGVSLDNDEKAWKKAVETMNMTWYQMSDLKGWKSSAADLYGVRGIPATVLITQDGTIVERDLTGKDLEEAIQKYLAK